ncbi:MAG: response regulator [Deltaproteobacteria bacterium]|nr:response regulator [Deltaproteobacteria bacterium]
MSSSTDHPVLEQVRLRLVLGVGALSWLAFGLQYAWMGRWNTVIIDLSVALVVGLVAWRVRLSTRPVVLGHAALGVSLVGLLLAAMLSGQGDAMALWYVPAMPMIAGYVFGLKAAVLWAAVGALGVVAVHLSALVVRVTPEFVVQGPELAAGQVGLVLAIVALATGAEHARREQARELARARDEALSAERTRTEFLARVSHELRTPLNAVIGMAGLLSRTPLTAEQERMTRVVDHSAGTLLNLVNEVLDLSKIEVDDISMDVVPFEPRRLLVEIAGMLEHQTGAVELHLEATPSVPEWVMSDPGHLQQVLVNLLSNALRFTERGRVHAELSHRDAWLVARVADSGVGIPAGELDSIFEPFHQVSGTRGGTGLGLSITRRLVEGMGGTITVESRVGEGSVFTFRIPAPSSDAPKVASEEYELARVPGVGLRVLVAEDNPINREVTGAILERLGHRFSMVDDGAAAVEAVHRQDYDVVLMDVHMPGMNGLEAARAIREQIPAARRPRIVALTASVFDGQREACREAGMDSFVAKPIDPVRIAQVLGSVPLKQSGEIELGPLDKLQRVCRTPERFEALVRRHIESSRRTIEEIGQAADGGDHETVERLAHGLKSSAAMFGSEELSEVAREIEELTRVGRDAANGIVSLMDCWERARARLEKSVRIALSEEAALLRKVEP